MKKFTSINIIIYLILFSNLIFCCSNDNEELESINNIIPESMNNNSVWENENIIENDFDVNKLNNTIDNLYTSYNIPIILHKNGIRFRTHPSFTADVKSIANSGTSISIIKQSTNKYVDIFNNESYWYYVDAKTISPRFGKQSGWVFGDDIFNDGYKYPYKENIPKVHLSEEAIDKDVFNNVLCKEYMIDKNNVEMYYEPNLYSSPVYILNKGDFIKISEKTSFRQNLFNFNYGKWYYAHNKNEKVVKGWIYQSFLPNNIPKKIPLNLVYRIINDAPVYIGEIILDSSEFSYNNTQYNNKSILQLKCQINPDGLITDIPSVYGYFLDNDKSGYMRWAEKTLENAPFYLYNNGHEIGKFIPQKEDIKNIDKLINNYNNKIVVNGNLDLKKNYKRIQGKILAFSIDVAQIDSRFILRKYDINQIDQAIKNKVNNIVLEEFEKEFKINIDENKYKIDKIFDIAPFNYEGSLNYIFVSDLRLFKLDDNDRISSDDAGNGSFVFKLIGIVTEKENITIIESFFKRVRGIEATKFIKSYNGIAGVIDIDKDGDDEIIIDVMDIDGYSEFKIIMPNKKNYYTLYE